MLTIKEVEKYNKTLSEEVKYPNYQTKETVWHSKLINTKQITELLQNSPEIAITENFDSLLINPQELELELQAQQEIPPKYENQIEQPPK